MQRRAPQTSDIDDETLFAKVERGDVEAFTAVYNKYHKLLYALAYRYLMSSAMAEDAVQHSFFTRLLTFRLWGGVSRLTPVILHQRRKWQAPHTRFLLVGKFSVRCVLQRGAYPRP